MPRDFDGSRSQNHEKAFKAGNQTFELCQINLLALALKACFITLRFFFDPLIITAKSILLYICIQLFKTRKIVWNIDKDEFQIHKIPHFNLILFDLKIRFRVIKLKLQVFDYSVFHHNVKKNDEEPNLEIFNCETLFVQKRRMIVKNHFP